ncbi:prenyltransferase [Microbacterium alcoholitolerans]|uniref:prenyltransferase n=1 Tax=unclassified Microbacterium TaxID=2609290 RepID=UPI003D16B270
MTYVWLSVAFLAVAIGAGAILARVSTARAGETGGAGSHWRAVSLTALALVALTAVFDSLMIAAELFHYDPAHTLGVTIGLAPVEDFAYPIACAALLPGLWLVLARSRREYRLLGKDGLLRQALVASRPVSWINTAFPFAAAMLLTTREIDWVLIVGAIYFLVPYNLAMYGINDVFDYASDIRNPRKGGIEGALLAPPLHRPMLWLAAITNIPFLIVLMLAGGPVAWFSIAVSAFAVVAYSAPGLRFKERPVIDSVTSSTHFVSPAIVGLALAGATPTAGLTLLLVAFFLWGMAAHAFGAVQDIEPDREAGIGSIATVLGARRTVRLAIVVWAVAGLVMLFTPWPGPLAAIVAVPYMVNCARWWNVTDANATKTNISWRRFIWLNYASGFVITMILILAWSLGP